MTTSFATRKSRVQIPPAPLNPWSGQFGQVGRLSFSTIPPCAASRVHHSISALEAPLEARRSAISLVWPIRAQAPCLRKWAASPSTGKTSVLEVDPSRRTRCTHTRGACNRACLDVSATKPRKAHASSRWRAAGLMILSLTAIVAGSELLVEGGDHHPTDRAHRHLPWGWPSSHLPVAGITVAVIALLMWHKTRPRWSGAILVALDVV